MVVLPDRLYTPVQPATQTLQAGAVHVHTLCTLTKKFRQARHLCWVQLRTGCSWGCQAAGGQHLQESTNEFCNLSARKLVYPKHAEL